MNLSVGKRRGLQECSTGKGKFAILALDQRGSLRRAFKANTSKTATYIDLVQFKKDVVSILAPETNAILLDPEYGIAQNLTDSNIPGTTGLIVALEETGYEGKSNNRVSKILSGWSVSKSQKVGGSAVKLLIYYHPESKTREHQQQLISNIALECQRLDVAFFLEPIVYSINPQKEKPNPSERRQTITKTAQELSLLGADILKLQFPVDNNECSDKTTWLNACKEITEVCKVPWVLLSAGVDFEVFIDQVKVACVGGASGVMVGRAVWKEAINLNDNERQQFLREIAVPRFRKLKSICDESATSWSSYFQSKPIKENWYLDY